MVFVSVVVIAASVSLHALVMRTIYNKLCRPSRRPWIRLSVMVITLLAAHLVQIVFFALAYQQLGDPAGDLRGAYDGSFGDAVYFSMAVFTTVGFGDITPVGHLRLLVGLEALAGLVLITWSASFTFVAMSRLTKIETDSAASVKRSDD
ncbi:MAG: potassium channel family protein [Planctomycetota bacterium]